MKPKNQDEFDFDDDGEAKKGKDRRDLCADRVLSHTPEEWKKAFLSAVYQLKAKAVPFTAEDIREITGDPPNHCNAMSAAVLGAVRMGIIKPVGYTHAKRKTSNSCLLRLYL